MEERKPPVEKGEHHTLKCEGVGSQNDGIMKVNGFVIFVEGASPGNTYKIEITKVLRNVGFGEILELVG